MKTTSLKIKELNQQLSHYHLNLSKKDQAVLLEKQEHHIILINKQPAFFYHQDKPIPTLKYLQQNQILKKITVDMGAVKFVINGADIMRPGITQIENNIEKDEPIVIVDKNNHKPLAVGIALLNSTEMEEQTEGKSIKNIHYIGDEIWNLQ